MHPKHPCDFRKTIGRCHDVSIQFLIFHSAVITLGSVPFFKALLGNSALTQNFYNFKMPFGNQFIGSSFFQPKTLTKLLY